MPLDEILEQAGLFRFPQGFVGSVLAPFPRASSRFVYDLLAANVAEWTAFGASVFTSGQLPYAVQERAADWIVYKTDTIQITCEPHADPRSARRSEYLFLFTSDCWKVRSLFGAEPVEVFTEAPGRARDAYRYLSERWQFSPGPAESNALALRVTVLLWAVKAYLFDGPDDDALRQRVDQLARELEIG